MSFCNLSVGLNATLHLSVSHALMQKNVDKANLNLGTKLCLMNKAPWRYRSEGTQLQRQSTCLAALDNLFNGFPQILLI